MSPITYAVRRITQEIPREILTQAFGRKTLYGHQDTQSIENAIAQDVIYSYVMNDLNMVMGTHVDIKIGTLPYREMNNAHVYDIPLRMTQGRHITRVLSVETGTPDAGPGQSSMDRLLNASMPGPESSGTARVEIVAPNVVALYEYSNGINTFLRCVLANEENLSNLNAGYQRRFIELCVLASKALIYQRLDIAIGDGIQNGSPTNPQLRGRIDSYADAYELYNEQLDTRWNKINVLNDPKAKNRHIRSLLG